MRRGPVALALLLLVPGLAAAAGRPVTLVASDGTTLSATFYETSARPAPAVVLVHMLGRSKDEWSTFAERLQDAGIASLALDLRGHGRSGGDGTALATMVNDVRAGVSWLLTNPGVRPDAIAVVGGSLGANLAAIVAGEMPSIRAVGMLSPSLDYRGVRLDPAVMRKIGERRAFMAASTEDPYALRTLKELEAGNSTREQRLSGARAHGTVLLAADEELARALVDWLRRSLIS